MTGNQLKAVDNPQTWWTAAAVIAAYAAVTVGIYAVITRGLVKRFEDISEQLARIESRLARSIEAKLDDHDERTLSLRH